MNNKDSIFYHTCFNDPLWLSHKIGDVYTMDGKPEEWKIAYYAIIHDGRVPYIGKETERYNEPRALVERPMQGGGTDFREIPLRYLTRKP